MYILLLIQLNQILLLGLVIILLLKWITSFMIVTPEHLPWTQHPSNFFLLKWKISSPSSPPPTHAHNTTPFQNNFHYYLTLTYLVSKINNKTTITVCNIDTAIMDYLLIEHRILLDYFSMKKLHQIINNTMLTTTIYQAIGTTLGYVIFNINKPQCT